MSSRATARTAIIASSSRRFFTLLASLLLVVLSAREAAAGPSFVYALQEVHDGANQIHGFRIDPLTGTLTALPGFPVATGGNGRQDAGTFSEQLVFGGGRLFAVNDGLGSDDTLSVFVVNQTTGALTALPFSPIALGSAGTWRSVAVHPSGSPVVVGNLTTNALASFNITPTSVTAAAGGPFLLGPGSWPHSLAFSRDGSYVYAGDASGNGIAGFSVATNTGVLTALTGSPFDSGSPSPGAYATDSEGRLFIANTSVPEVRAFTTSAGVLTAVPGNPFPSGVTTARRGVLHPAGFYVVSYGGADSKVGVYRISGSGQGTTLSAVAGSPFDSGSSTTNTLALTTEGTLLVAGKAHFRSLRVFQMHTGTGALTLLSGQPLNTLGTSGIISGLALVTLPTVSDFNGDRHADLLWRHKVTGQNIGWLMNGTTVASFALLSPIADTNWEAQGVGDLDADGKADVIWRNNATGQNKAWLMDGLTVASAADLPTFADTNWEIKGVGDFDGDGKADLIWRNKVTGQNLGWLMNGTSLAAWAPLPTNTKMEIKGIGDLDGDGKADVILRNKVNGWNVGWLMDGLTIASSAFLPTMAATWEIKGVGDFNTDLKADVIWRNTMSGETFGWLMNGLDVASSRFLPTIADTNWDIKAVGDVSGDGRADVIWRNRVTGANIAWLMNKLHVSTSAFLPVIADTNWGIVGR